MDFCLLGSNIVPNGEFRLVGYGKFTTIFLNIQKKPRQQVWLILQFNCGEVGGDYDGAREML